MSVTLAVLALLQERKIGAASLSARLRRDIPRGIISTQIIIIIATASVIISSPMSVVMMLCLFLGAAAQFLRRGRPVRIVPADRVEMALAGC